MELIGIGLGPGDPELLTLKAVRNLGAIDVAMVAASLKSGRSYALEIAHKYLRPDSEVIKAFFPMTRDSEELEEVYDRYADLVHGLVSGGKRVGFLCIGDPLLYSTYGRLLMSLRKHHPEVPVTTLPGVPSFCAAAAAANRVMVLEDEILSIVPVNSADKVTRAALGCDSMVLLKIYREKAEAIGMLEKAGFVEDLLYIEKAGHPDQYMSEDIETIRRKDGTYLSILFANRRTD
ncbi:MAG: precorrin-2 C(20)-methyltransferase [Spirochaetota bacterium]